MRHLRITALLTVVFAYFAIGMPSFVLAATPTPDFTIERSVALLSGDDAWFTQARASVLPGGDQSAPSVIIVAQRTGRTGTHNYQDFFQIRTDDMGKTWSKPRALVSLRRAVFNDKGDERVVGDFWPKLHEPSGVVFGTGKTFTFRGGKNEDKSGERVSYSVYNPETKQWNGLNVLDIPKWDRTGAAILEPNAGCTQRVDLPGGNVLLPIRYRRSGSKGHQYTTIVARCGFDGEKLTYKTYGSELTINRDRGLCEPSLAQFQGRFFLTIRADHSAFVARSDDGLNYEPIREWTFDDGKVLGSYNTQQHWVTHPKGLFLVYTRRGANNDHIMRHRAPLFIAQVDPERLCVLRDTERVVLPEENATLGNFGVVKVTPKETWVIASEYPRNQRINDKNRTQVAKIIWKE